MILGFPQKIHKGFFKIKVKKEGHFYPMGVRIIMEQSHVHVCMAFFNEEEFTILSCQRFGHLGI